MTHWECTRTSVGESPLELAHHEGDARRSVDRPLERDELELAEPGREARLGDAAHELLHAAAVLDEVADRDDPEVVLLRDIDELGYARHRAVLRHDLAQHAGVLEPREPHEIDGRFRVPRAAEHPSPRRPERKDVPRTGEILRARLRIDEGANRDGAIVGADARRRPVNRVDGNGERRAHLRGVLLDHETEAKLVGALLVERGADEPAGVPRDEVDALGGHELRGHDDVPFVLAILVVDDDEHPPPFDILERVFDAAEYAHRRSPPFFACAR